MSNSPDYLEHILNKGKRRSRHKFESLKEGSTVYRILPSFNANNPQIEAVYRVHWLTGEEGRMTKVACTYYTERYCPLCEKHRETKDALQAAKATDPNSQNAKRLQEAEDKLRVSKAIFYNAVNAANELVVLQVSATVSGLLEKKIVEAVQQKGFDPLAVNGGVWFRFTKQGKGRDSVTVDYNRISVKDADGEIAEKLDRRALPEELTARIASDSADIHSPGTVYVNEYSSAELAAYLRGTPLPSRRRTDAVAAPSASNQASESSNSMTSTRGAVTADVEDDVPIEPAGRSGAAATKSAADYAAEAERFRRLLNQGR